MKRADAVAARFCRAERHKQLVADKSLVHPDAAIDYVDQEAAAVAVRAKDDGLARRRGVESVLDEVGERRAELVGGDRHIAALALATDLGGDRELRRHRACDCGRVGAPWRRETIGFELAQQIVHPRYRILYGLKHVALKFGVVDVAARIRDDKAELAGEVLDVVDNKREAFAVLGQ